MSQEKSCAAQKQIHNSGAVQDRGQHHSQQLSAINARLQQLLDKRLFSNPYLITVPSDVPYRHSSRFVHTWFVGTPFAREEEQLQYLSFLRPPDGEPSLLQARVDWSDEFGNMVNEENSPREVQKSGLNTPASSANRKKISLYDYKNKSKGMSESAVAADTNAMNGNTEKSNGIAVTVPKKEEAAISPEAAEPPMIKKRSHDEIMGQQSHNSLKGSESPRPEKKSRIEPPTQNKALEATHRPPMATKAVRENTSQSSSDTRPASADPAEIPELLSPTLPAPIEEFLADQPNNSQVDGGHEHLRTDPVRSILAGAGLEFSPHPNAKKSPLLKPGAVRMRDRSESQQSAKSIQSVASVADRLINGKTTSYTAPPLANGTGSSPGPRRRHVIALRYGKRNRKRVEALLKFAPRAKKPVVKLVPDQKSLPTQGRSRLDNKSSLSQVMKRSISEVSIESENKRRKVAGAALLPSEKPRTPIPPLQNSPSAQTAVQPKSAFSTPKKEFKVTAMRRGESAEGVDASTPAGGHTRQSTPISVDRNSTNIRTSPASTSVPSSWHDERQAWNHLHQKYFELGRTIKKEGTSYGPSPSNEPSEKEAALSVILLIEALCCFMINLTALEKTQSTPDPGWRTIIPYHIFVFRASRRFPQLHGLVVQLGAVCRQLINKYDVDRLAREPLPEEHTTNSAPTPGSDGNTKINTDDYEKYKKRYLDFRNELVTNVRELQIAWLDGSRLLSADALEREFSKTWTKRSSNFAARGMERLEPGKIGGDYYLPLDVNTTPIEACRFTVAFLAEWCLKEGVKWKTRIEL